jgi:formate hydrogenlyase transcriptional activator
VHDVQDETDPKHSEERLRTSELRYRRLFETAKDGILILDAETGKITDINPFLVDLLGYSLDEFIGAHLWDLAPFKDVKKCKLAFAELQEKEYIRYESLPLETKDGRSIAVEFVGNVYALSAGTRVIQCNIRDITERRRMEEIRERLAAVVDFSEDAIIGKNPDGTIVSWNQGAEKIFGYSAREVMGKSMLLLFPADRVKEESSILERIRHGESVQHFETVRVRKDGGRVDISVTISPIKDSSGVIIGASTIARDITKRGQMEAALRESEERYRALVTATSDVVYRMSPDWSAMRQLHGRGFLADTEAPNRNWLQQYIHQDDQGRVMAAISRAIQAKSIFELEHPVIRADGSLGWTFSRAIPVKDATGEIVEWFGAASDVTERKRMEEELREAKKKLAEEKLYLEQEIDMEMGFGEIVGRSKALQSVMANVRRVASTDATVLLLGETGTGKEMVARAVHRTSRRSDAGFIKMNCAAIPSGLLESELFGSEKGAFTGAANQKIGRLELADKGTLFLDEIGEIPLELQPKLLRVLQDQEFERLGGLKTLKVNFRLVAATNRDLEKAVRDNEFRSDLYYRLKVFPIRIPPLRERREDIRLLVEHFVQKFCLRMKKSITSIPKRTMDALCGLDWPGNVRELENIIERAVILTQGSVLVVPLSEIMPIQEEKRKGQTLEAAQRDHIVRALRQSHGQIGGMSGAAGRLGMKRTTLQSKMKHLGIDPWSGRPQH